MRRCGYESRFPDLERLIIRTIAGQPRTWEKVGGGSLPNSARQPAALVIFLRAVQGLPGEKSDDGENGNHPSQH